MAAAKQGITPIVPFPHQSQYPQMFWNWTQLGVVSNHLLGNATTRSLHCGPFRTRLGQQPAL
jgi:hypothetical protein